MIYSFIIIESHFFIIINELRVSLRGGEGARVFAFQLEAGWLKHFTILSNAALPAPLSAVYEEPLACVLFRPSWGVGLFETALLVFKKCFEGHKCWAIFLFKKVLRGTRGLEIFFYVALLGLLATVLALASKLMFRAVLRGVDLLIGKLWLRAVLRGVDLLIGKLVFRAVFNVCVWGGGLTC